MACRRTRGYTGCHGNHALGFETTIRHRYMRMNTSNRTHLSYNTTTLNSTASNLTYRLTAVRRVDVTASHAVARARGKVGSG